MIGRSRRSSFHLDEQFVLVEVALNNPSLSLKEVLWEIRNSTGEYFALFTETSHGSDLLSKRYVINWFAYICEYTCACNLHNCQ